MTFDQTEFPRVRPPAVVRAALVVAVVLFSWAVAGWAFAGSGTGTITAVTDNEDNTYALTCSSVSGLTVGDHLHARLSSGAGGLYVISAINTSTNVVTVADTLTEERGSAFGAPTTGTFGYDTPTAGGLSLVPYASTGWDAAHRRNFVLTGALASSGDASVSSSTSAYAAARTVTIPAYHFDRIGAEVIVHANIRQAAGSGVYARVTLGSTSSTALTAVGDATFRLVRENTGNVVIYSSLVGSSASQYQRDSVSSLNFTADLTLTLDLQGGDDAGGTGNDHWLVLLR